MTDKETPKSIQIQDEEGREYIDYICPYCGWVISQARKGQIYGIYKPKYHDECGQHLDWNNPQKLEAGK